MVLTVVGENVLTGNHVLEPPQRKIFSDRNVLKSLQGIVMVNSSDIRVRNMH